VNGKDPSTWPQPSTEYTCEDSGYGTVRIRAWANLHPKVRTHEGRGSRGPLPIVHGRLVLVEVQRLPRGERRREPRVLWLWWHGPEGEAPNLDLANAWYTRQATETLWTLARAAQRPSLRPGEALPGHQKERLSQRKLQTREFCDGHKAHQRTPPG
jgi:hypothetical protein